LRLSMSFQLARCTNTFRFAHFNRLLMIFCRKEQ
jgi:hypothetical protein